MTAATRTFDQVVNLCEQALFGLEPTSHSVEGRGSITKTGWKSPVGLSEQEKSHRSSTVEKLAILIADRKLLLNDYKKDQEKIWQNSLLNLLKAQSCDGYTEHFGRAIRAMAEILIFDIDAAKAGEIIFRPSSFEAQYSLDIRSISDPRQALDLYCINAALHGKIALYPELPNDIFEGKLFEFSPYLNMGFKKSLLPGSWFHQSLQVTWGLASKEDSRTKLDAIQITAKSSADFRLSLQCVYSMESLIQIDPNLTLGAIVEPYGLFWAAHSEPRSLGEYVHMAAIHCLAEIVNGEGNNQNAVEAATQAIKLLFHLPRTTHQRVKPFVENMYQKLENKLKIDVQGHVFSGKERLEELIRAGWQENRDEYCGLRLQQLRGIDTIIRNSIDAKNSIRSCLDPIATGPIELRPPLPNYLCCPITGELIRDPFYGSDGYIYERSSGEKLLGEVSPVDRSITNLEEKSIPRLLLLELKRFKEIYPELVYPEAADRGAPLHEAPNCDAADAEVAIDRLNDNSEDNEQPPPLPPITTNDNYAERRRRALGY